MATTNEMKIKVVIVTLARLFTGGGGSENTLKTTQKTNRLDANLSPKELPQIERGWVASRGTEKHKASSRVQKIGALRKRFHISTINNLLLA